MLSNSILIKGGQYLTSTVDANPFMIAGGFTSYGGATNSPRLISLNFDGTRTAFMSNFSPTASALVETVNKIAIDDSGSVYAAGVFTRYQGITANGIVKIDKNGNTVTSFSTGSGFDVSLSHVDIMFYNYKLYVGGNFSTYNGLTANKLLRLNSDGSVDSSFNTGVGLSGSWVNTIAKNISDDKIYVGGKFNNYNGTLQPGLIRLNTDGSLDTTFNSGATGFPITTTDINKILVSSDGKLYVMGSFTHYNGTSFTSITGNNKMMRLNSDGSIDTSFVTKSFYGANDSILYAGSINSNGKIYVGGGFQTYDGTNVYSIVRLNSDGTKDTSFNTGTGLNIGFHTSAPDSAVIYDLFVDYADNIYVCGLWTSYSGTASKNLIKLKDSGSIDTTFVVRDILSNPVKSLNVNKLT